MGPWIRCLFTYPKHPNKKIRERLFTIRIISWVLREHRPNWLLERRTRKLQERKRAHRYEFQESIQQFCAHFFRRKTVAHISKQRHKFRGREKFYTVARNWRSVQSLQSIQWHTIWGLYNEIRTVRTLLVWHEFRDKIPNYADEIIWNFVVAFILLKK